MDINQPTNLQQVNTPASAPAPQVPAATPQPTTVPPDTTVEVDTEPSPVDLMYMMACYCYINASKIGYQALKELNPAFLVINSLKNPDILNAVNNATSKMQDIDADEAAVEKEIGEQSKPDVDTPISK